MPSVRRATFGGDVDAPSNQAFRCSQSPRSRFVMSGDAIGADAGYSSPRESKRRGPAIGEYGGFRTTHRESCIRVGTRMTSAARHRGGRLPCCMRRRHRKARCARPSISSSSHRSAAPGSPEHLGRCLQAAVCLHGETSRDGARCVSELVRAQATAASTIESSRLDRVGEQSV